MRSQLRLPRAQMAATGLLAAVLGGAALATACSEPGDAEPAEEPVAEIAPPQESRLFGGEMVYMADAARITLCKTGRSLPIAMEGEYPALERAYLEARSGPGASLYVTLEGSIAPRPKMEGEGTEPSLVVQRFVHAWPDLTCERARADASLTNTYWRIVRLGQESVGVGEEGREPHLLLREDGEGARYGATVGCNQLGGAFTIDGEELAFGPAAATMMACQPPLDALERALGETLARTRGWRIEASTMELVDERGAPLALFEAVYF